MSLQDDIDNYTNQFNEQFNNVSLLEDILYKKILYSCMLDTLGRARYPKKSNQTRITSFLRNYAGLAEMDRVSLIQLLFHLDHTLSPNEKSAKSMAMCNKDYGNIKPISGVIGFYGRGPKELSNQKEGAKWLNENVRYLFAICILGKFSWFKLQDRRWCISESNKDFEETKRFIAVYLDNLRTTSELRINFLGEFAHKDWLSIYIREQKLFDS